jgi:hypothetical protein
VNVTIGCICAPKGDGSVRHPDGDRVELRERLDFRTTVTIQKSVMFLGEDPSNPEILAALTEAYLLFGISAWTVQDERGKAIPVNRGAIEQHLLPNIEAALAVADAADDLYQETVLLPLLMRGSGSSGTSPTTRSTSRRTSSPPVPLRRSKRSSTTTSRTDDTATTSASLDGGSSSSPSSESAA